MQEYAQVPELKRMNWTEDESVEAMESRVITSDALEPENSAHQDEDPASIGSMLEAAALPTNPTIPTDDSPQRPSLPAGTPIGSDGWPALIPDPLPPITNMSIDCDEVESAEDEVVPAAAPAPTSASASSSATPAALLPVLPRPGSQPYEPVDHLRRVYAREAYEAPVVKMIRHARGAPTFHVLYIKKPINRPKLFIPASFDEDIEDRPQYVLHEEQMKRVDPETPLFLSAAALAREAAAEAAVETALDQQQRAPLPRPTTQGGIAATQTLQLWRLRRNAKAEAEANGEDVGVDTDTTGADIDDTESDVDLDLEDVVFQGRYGYASRLWQEATQAHVDVEERSGDGEGVDRGAPTRENEGEGEGGGIEGDHPMEL